MPCSNCAASVPRCGWRRSTPGPTPRWWWLVRQRPAMPRSCVWRCASSTPCWQAAAAVRDTDAGASPAQHGLFFVDTAGGNDNTIGAARTTAGSKRETAGQVALTTEGCKGRQERHDEPAMPRRRG
ncbi:hypothetical protein DF3PB_480017 [uncultured Defluviicoccus sp.]|uniref:Uncharacterized protein n=1 Tax=metagenome TaxID=256318 RepID=A0A380TI20_9ZZZZ|nr:hypothetical protein DF3PB_480017 [uncultured Defluviicoccus sp.]